MPQRSTRAWHYVAAALLALALMAPTVYVVATMQRQAEKNGRLEAVVDRQAATLTDHGLPANGTPGADGKAGTPGADGKAGTPGADGKDGRDGKDGAPGPAPVAIQVPVVGGGWCFATDPDGDGVYMCPEAAV